jgi:hypothetical protein
LNTKPIIRDERRLEERPAVSRRHFGAHGFRRRHVDGATHGGKGTGDRRDERHHRGSGEDTQGHAEEQHRKAKEGVVEADDEIAHHRAEDAADHYSHQSNRERPLEIVPADRPVVVAKRFERCDLRPLQRERAGQRDVEDEGRHHHENQWQHEPERLQLRQLVLHRPVRQLQRARNRAEATVRLQNAVDARDDLIGRRARRDRQHDVVEAALHVEGGGERLLVHPENRKAFVVGHQLARPDAVDELRRQRDADDGELAQTSVQHGRHLVAELELVGDHEAFAGEHFIAAAAFDPAPTPQEEIVDERPPVRGNRHEPAAGRFVEAFEVERHVGDHACLDRRDIGNRPNLVGHPQWCPFQRREHVAESLLLVVRVTRPVQRVEGREVHDVHRHAGRDDHRDRKRLALHRQQVAPEFPVERGDSHVTT